MIPDIRKDIYRKTIGSLVTIVLICIFVLLLCLMFSGCGHSLFHKVEGTGAYFRIPTPDGGGSIVELAMGDMVITSGVLRGGAVYDDNASKGGTFGSASLGRRTYMATSPAMNEGNVAEVLTSPDADPATKQLIATYLITRSQPTPYPAATTAVNAGSVTGTANAPVATPTRTGIDHVTSTVGEVAPKIVEPVADATVKVVDKVADTTSDVTGNVVEVSKDWSSTIKLAVYVVGGVLLLAIIIVAVLYWYKRKKAKDSVLESPPSPVQQDF